MGSLPHEAKVVVIGGGIAGCSTAYHLADNGWDTVLIERDVLTSGTTWHAAGMITQLGTTPQITKIRKYSVKFYNEHLYVLISNNKEIIGCVSITYEMDDFYKNIDWISPSNKNIYVHRLAVHPNHQGQGYAKKIMKFIEEKGIKNMCESIRLDTFSMNKRNNALYKKIGYEKLGQIYFRDQSELPFNCYEKPLKQPIEFCKN